MDKLSANLILEILGRPPEHIKEALTTLVMRLGSEKGVKIVKKDVHDPIKVENSEDLFTTFCELNAEFDSLEILLGIAFAYMPSHIEVVYPEKIILQNHQINELTNKLLTRLHDYDSITKQSIAEKETLLKKLYEIAPHLFKQVPKEQEKVKKANKKKKSKS